MTDVPAPAGVSLSRRLGSETPRHPTLRRDSGETIGETLSLKALALLVISRDSSRDAERDRVARSARESELSRETVLSAETAAAWTEAEAERAAIVEHDGAIPRAWAEGFARLDSDRPPGDVPLKRWQRFVDDVGLFLDSPFCAVAVALGWGPHDLFGCDRDRPFAQIDRAGLLWLINGDELVALSEYTAGIQSRTGERHTYRREPSEPDRMLAWELRDEPASRTEGSGETTGHGGPE